MDLDFIKWVSGMVGGGLFGYIFGRKKMNAEAGKILNESNKIFEETESLKIFNQKATLEIHKIVVVELKAHLETFHNKCKDLSKENEICEHKRKKLEERIKVLEQKNR